MKIVMLTVIPGAAFVLLAIILGMRTYMSNPASRLTLSVAFAILFLIGIIWLMPLKKNYKTPDAIRNDRMNQLLDIIIQDREKGIRNIGRIDILRELTHIAEYHTKACALKPQEHCECGTTSARKILRLCDLPVPKN
ncbi:MAG: hypothetical protein AAB407_03360 [Patescibacteria group bacterium]